MPVPRGQQQEDTRRDHEECNCRSTGRAWPLAAPPTFHTLSRLALPKGDPRPCATSPCLLSLSRGPPCQTSATPELGELPAAAVSTIASAVAVHNTRFLCCSAGRQESITSPSRATATGLAERPLFWRLHGAACPLPCPAPRVRPHSLHSDSGPPLPSPRAPQMPPGPLATPGSDPQPNHVCEVPLVT